MTRDSENILKEIRSSKDSLNRHVETMREIIVANVSETVKVIGDRVEKTVFEVTDGIDDLVSRIKTGASIKHQVAVRPAIVFGISVSVGVLFAVYGPARFSRLIFRAAVNNPIVQNAAISIAFGLLSDYSQAKEEKAN